MPAKHWDGHPKFNKIVVKADMEERERERTEKVVFFLDVHMSLELC